MKQRSKVIATSIATIAMCASLAVGGTFALFTSESEVNIAVTSGTVDVKASVNKESLKTYSMGAIQEKGKFQNGGTASFTPDSKLELSLMTPGDKAEFTVDIANNSNVAIQYKVSFDVKGGLVGALDCDATNAENTWIFAEAGKAIDSVAVSVELPESVDDTYQNVTDTTISVKVEAVQGNANVGGATIEDSEEDVALENVFTEDLLKKEDIVVKLGKANLTWATGAGIGSTPFGNENTKTLTIVGESPETSKLTATGSGVGAIRVENGTLIIQNVEIIDETVSYAENSWEYGYLELGGGNADTLVFENCVFNKAIQISGNATFKNCKFNSNADNEYAVWVCGGNASFEDCYFTGPRGLKMHEAYGSEVVSVTVENCTFENLTKKPGIAMGTLNAETSVTIKNSQFINCQAGDQGLYMYETDTNVTSFTFVNENNFVATIVTDGLYKMADGSYAVTNANGLKYFSTKALTGNNGVAESATISLLNDIDMQGAEFSAIIAQRGDTLNFKGNGCTISNVNVVSGDNDNTTGQASLFYAYPNSTLNVSNLVISNVTATAELNGTAYAAAIVGYAEGNVVLNNVDVIKATVKGGKSSGSLVGHLSGSLTATDCSVTDSSVTLVEFSEEPNGHYAGKVLGTLAGPAKLTGCEFDVTVSGNLNASNIGDVYGRKTAAGSLSVDGVDFVDTAEKLTSVLTSGASEMNVSLSAGEYTMPEPTLQGKTLTITGTKDTVIDVSNVDARDQFVTGATLVFDGVTLNFGTVNYMGFANTDSLTYKNCKINGLQFLFGKNVTFENCEFDSNGAEHCVWTYGAQNVSFKECTFTYGDRGINCYSDNDVAGGQTVSFEKCKFITENTASKGAVEINSCFITDGIKVNMTGCTAPAYGEMAYVSEWDNTNGAKTTINIQ